MMEERVDEPSTSAGRSLQPSRSRLSKLKYSTVEMKLTGSQPWNKLTGLEPTGGVSNYIRGKDGKDSLNGMPNYARVTVSGVYDGVDLASTQP